MLTIHKRRNIVELCKAVIKYMDVQDGREEIDTLLDKAAIGLADVSQRMHDYWIRALDEREAEEARQAARTEAREHARVNKITRGVMSARRQLDLAMKAHPALMKSLIKEHLSSITDEEDSDGSVEKRDEEEETADTQLIPQSGNTLRPIQP